MSNCLFPEDDDEPHTALDNIRERLELMCKGQLTITPREGGHKSPPPKNGRKGGKSRPLSPNAGIWQIKRW